MDATTMAVATGQIGTHLIGILWYCHFYPHPCRAILLQSLVNPLGSWSGHLTAEHLLRDGMRPFRITEEG
jgi:hypothetical protein